MKNYTDRYLARTEEGLVWITVEIDYTPFLIDGSNESEAIEQACEVFERNCSNFIQW